jgi:hypothetical protein
MQWLNPSKHCANLHCLRDETNIEIFNIIKDIQNGNKINIISEFDRFI